MGARHYAFCCSLSNLFNTFRYANYYEYHSNPSSNGFKLGILGSRCRSVNKYAIRRIQRKQEEKSACVFTLCSWFYGLRWCFQLCNASLDKQIVIGLALVITLGIGQFAARWRL
jgi:hypothetical protein